MFCLSTLYCTSHFHFRTISDVKPHQNLHTHLDSQLTNGLTANAINVRLDDLEHTPSSFSIMPTSDVSHLKSTSLIMQTIKTSWDEPHNTVNSHDNKSSEATFGNSTTRSSSLAKTSSTSSVQSDAILFNISNIISNSSSASSLSMNQMDPAPMLEKNKTLVCSVDGKPIAAPRIKKIGGSAAKDGLSHQLSQLRRIYEAAELESLENELVDNEVQLYLGSGGEVENTNELEDKSNTEVSGSWSRLRAKRIMTGQKGGVLSDNIIF